MWLPCNPIAVLCAEGAPSPDPLPSPPLPWTPLLAPSLRSPYLWKDPDAFRPERFSEKFENPDFGGKWAGYNPELQGSSLYPNEVASDFALLPFGEFGGREGRGKGGGDSWQGDLMRTAAWNSAATGGHAVAAVRCWPWVSTACLRDPGTANPDQVGAVHEHEFLLTSACPGPVLALPEGGRMRCGWHLYPWAGPVPTHVPPPVAWCAHVDVAGCVPFALVVFFNQPAPMPSALRCAVQQAYLREMWRTCRRWHPEVCGRPVCDDGGHCSTGHAGQVSMQG